MNLGHLGDRLDFCKRFILGELDHHGLLQDIAVDAMATSPPEWMDDDWHIYANVLQIEPAQIIVHHEDLSTSRLDPQTHCRRYFGEINHLGDIFLDPDTGILERSDEKHILPTELLYLLARNPQRVIAVYQHGLNRANTVPLQLQSAMAGLRRYANDVAAAAYDFGPAGIIFVSFDVGRIQRVADHFHALLGRHAERRIMLWEPVALR